MDFPTPNFQEPLQRRLTKMYSDTKKSYESVTEPPKLEVASELSSLHRKLQIQKNRLIAWGLEWSDRSAAASGDIDESLEREGLSDVVGSVLASIKDILQEAERMRYSKGTLKDQGGDGPGSRSEKATLKDYWAASDKPRFQDLLKDLTISIDTLYDLSRSCRAFRHTSQPDKGQGRTKPEHAENEKSNLSSNVATSKAGAESFPRPLLSAASSRSQQSLRIDYSALVIPDDGTPPPLQPPPYEAIANPPNPGVMGYFRHSNASSHPWKRDGNVVPTVPVLIDYAPIDSIYHETGIFPSMSRLDALAEAIHQSEGAARIVETGSLNLLGYFEDPKSPRYGLVYELPQTVYSGPADRSKSLESMAPCSLLSLLQTKVGNTGNSMTPSLDDRFHLAHTLAVSFFHLHATGVIHRDVTSNNIVFFRSTNAPGRPLPRLGGFDIRNPYITAFDLFTEYNYETPSTRTAADLYRHPQDARLGGRGFIKEYTPALDIYGLGLILLEIGLWLPLSNFWKPEVSLPTLKGSTLNTLVKKLGARCGTAYMRAVDSCLSIVEREQSREASGPQISYYWEVVKRLDRCCLIEEGDVQPPLASTPPPQVYPPLQPRTRDKSEQSLPSWLPLEKFRTSSDSIAESPQKSTEESDPISSHQSSIAQDAQSNQRPTIPDVECSPDPSAWNVRPNQASITQDVDPSQDSITQNVKPNQYSIGQEVKSAQDLTAQDILSKRGSPTPDVIIQISPNETSSAPSKPRLKMHPAKVSQWHLDEWHHKLLPRLERLMEKALKDSAETFTVDLIGVGESPQTATPTIFITCSSAGRVKGILNRYFTYDKTVFDLKVRKGKLRRSSAKKTSKQQRGGNPVRSAVRDVDEDPEAVNPFYYEKPLCGASIGAYKDDEHSLAVSYGGIVLVDGDPHGMTVHHMLEPPSDEEESDNEPAENEHAFRSSANSRSPNVNLGPNNCPPWTWREPYEGSYISDASEEEAEFESDQGYEEEYESSVGESSISEEESVHTVGDIRGVPQGEGANFPVTQPALQDIEEGYYPEPEDENEEHLASFHLGNIHASSGIRRLKQDGINHEIDWALFKIKKERLQPHNLISGGRRFCQYPVWNKRPQLTPPVSRHRAFREEEDLFPNRVAPVKHLAGLQVHSFGRTTGLRRGVISPAMSSVKIAGRTSSSRSWHVIGDFGIPGDSGAWVIDNDEGRVCGHVLAWCTEKAVAYICPMQILIQDMERTLASSITLPDSVDPPTQARRRSISENLETTFGGAARLQPPPRAEELVEPKTIAAEAGLPNIGNLRISSPGPPGHSSFSSSSSSVMTEPDIGSLRISSRKRRGSSSTERSAAFQNPVLGNQSKSIFGSGGSGAGGPGVGGGSGKQPIDERQMVTTSPMATSPMATTGGVV
ncbi:MAG: hypothetical protein M1837_003426 [Sclerophora amabilis]|nr:MAG: hypothetical protein M1837_003426 [Sclerophora amabilis]